MAWEHFLYAVDGEGIATLTLNRPDTLNSLTFEVYADLERLTRQLAADPEVRVLVITGAGRAFCSGGDVHEIIGPLLERDASEHLEFTRMTGAVVKGLRRMEAPVIAAVNGTAAGAGAVISLAADLRIVAQSATFSFLFTQVGLTGADMGAAWLLPRVVGLGRAAELLLVGEKVDAETAERMGLANRVVPDGRAYEEACALARKLARGPRAALAMTKRMLENEALMDLDAAIEAEAQAQALLLMGDDHRRFYESFCARKR